MSKDLLLDPILHDYQLKVFNSPSRFKVVMAGRRAGKTRLAIWEMIIFALKWPQSLIWYIAPTYGQAKSICWRKLLEIIPRELILKSHETELYIEFRNGSIIELKGCDNENTLRGRGPDLVILDETAFIKQHVWEEILRPSLIDRQGKGLFIGTPSGKNWFWKLWQFASSGLDREFEAFKFTTFENPFLPASEMETAKRQTTSSIIFQQEYMAEAQSHEGLVYPEFMHPVHAVEPFEISGARLFRAIDWGIQAPCVCLWGALMPGGEIYIYREHWKNGLPAPKQAEIIKGMTGKDVIEATVIDPSTRKRESKAMENRSYFESIQMQFTRCGIPTLLGYNNIQEGISIVKDLLVNGKLFFFNTCPKTISEIVSYEWATAAQEEGGNPNEKPKDGGDDCMDALRYLCCMLSGKARQAIDTPIKNCTIAEGNVFVTYENGEPVAFAPRKTPPWERGNSRQFDEYGGIMQ